MKISTLFIGLGILSGLNAMAANANDFQICWGDTDVHYARYSRPAGTSKAFEFSAWKGEKVNTEILIWAPEGLENAEVTISDLKSGKNVIPSEAASIHFVRYVIGDELAEGYGQCGARDTTNWKSISEADMLDSTSSSPVNASECQPVWITVNVPSGTVPGRYKGVVTVTSEGISKTLGIELQVKDLLMPEPSDWTFHLNLWQNPYSVARYYNVPLWSKEHFDYMRPLMKALADAGQKAITATIIDRPWNGQTEDAFGSMVTKIKRADGTWLYDYTIFDMWVEFMMSVGIDKEINCFSLIPWKLEFDYFDQATGRSATIQGSPKDKEYQLYWMHFIKDFASHLREKGWFDITTISMDERPMETMTGALSLIKSIEPEMKVSLAGNYIKEIEEQLYYLSATSTQEFPDDVRQRRLAEGKISTFYTCCAEKYPNTFIASVPAEASWIGWFAFAKGFEGYLRWAYNSWTINPIKDARFRTWAAGDTYMVYPDARSSVRFEKLIEGIRDYEKARILRSEWEASGNKTALKKLDDALKSFTIDRIASEGAVPAIRKARKSID